ncbi:phosphatase PAP2 family protein [Schaalia sp. ZJ405]|uniref:phosphatase PAP2 family protein n=1 Tax=Schaalia sp. ZJ405 TaxID=2709403 RepID=UPI0013EA874E|nr:phosphatase PAP2 family protein [Schaalia sp. ZJ405]QPK81257.1 phosphatase PAP2 family protein [Schaalia sp. ZJ405]
MNPSGELSSHVGGGQWYRRKLRRRLLGAGLCALFAIVGTWIALYSAWGQSVDTLLMESVMGWGHRLGDFARLMTSLISIPVIVIVGGFVAVVAVFRRRTTLAGRALGMVLAANVTTQLLKGVLDRPLLVSTADLPNSLPSGHTTIAMSLCLALIIVAPEWLREPAAWIGWAWASIIGITVMMQGWHRIVDVLVAVAICGVWALLLTPIERRRRHVPRAARIMWVITGVALVLGLCLLVVALVGIDVTSVASPRSLGYGFREFLDSQPWRARLLSIAAGLWVIGFCGAIIHEVDVLCEE